MYCPHYGREMAYVEGILTCVAGGMPLSRRMQETLSQRFPIQRSRPVGSLEGRSLTRWFCPGCGVLLDREMCCPACNQSIADLLFPLVEFHPHGEEDLSTDANKRVRNYSENTDS
jgi:hypothetical protein